MSTESDAVDDRSAIDDAYTWDLSAIYADESDWEAACERAEELIDDVADYEGRLTDDPETLAAGLRVRDELSRVIESIYAYARLHHDEDTRDDERQALLSRARSLATRARSASSYVEPAIQAADVDVATAIEAEPELAVYDHYIDDVRRLADHTRSSEVEELLADLSEVTSAGGDVYDRLANADMTFPSVDRPDGTEAEVTLNSFTSLLKHPDRAFRREVYETFYDEWESVRNAVATTYEKSLLADVTLARAREYESAHEAALDDPNVPVAVYETLVETVRERLPTLHRHVELKRRVVDDEVRMWDLYRPLVDDDPIVEYDRATEYVVDALSVLGEDYERRVREAIDSRWIDVYETPGKSAGGYSLGVYDAHPYILLNWQDDVTSMFTLAHELGHTVHSDYTNENQPHVYSSYEIFVAEVASTVNEALLARHLIETVDDEAFRRAVVNEYVERFRSTLFRQTKFAEFEATTHDLVEDDEPITAGRLDDLYRDLQADYYEPAVVDDRIVREWMRIPHFYSAFYVYQYATGISAAVALAEDIRSEGEPAAERYREFLRQGGHGYPLDLLADAGVDMRSPEPIERAIDVYGGFLDELADLL
ncbi:oligoendopeptidase F [Halobacteriales archaeon SW_7_68_16]|nr:MAG: oligoendopeptidase F [Halobacteriales archaeon SW_7_68_16]